MPSPIDDLFRHAAQLGLFTKLFLYARPTVNGAHLVVSSDGPRSEMPADSPYRLVLVWVDEDGQPRTLLRFTGRDVRAGEREIREHLDDAAERYRAAGHEVRALTDDEIALCLAARDNGWNVSVEIMRPEVHRVTRTWKQLCFIAPGVCQYRIVDEDGPEKPGRLIRIAGPKKIDEVTFDEIVATVTTAPPQN